jgi:hypothetical protein
MVVDDLREWADLIDFQPYAEIPVEIFIPVFEYPPNRTWSQPEIFPSKTVIQGNIEHGRRNYEKIFEQLSEAVKGESRSIYTLLLLLLTAPADPALWGYREITEDGIQTFVALESETSPFELRLLGQVVKSDPLSIPDELKHMVTIHESLPYPEFYDMAADAVS